MDLRLADRPALHGPGGAHLVADARIARRAQGGRDVHGGQPGQGDVARGEDHVEVAVAVGVDRLDVDHPAADAAAARDAGGAVRGRTCRRRAGAAVGTGSPPGRGWARTARARARGRSEERSDQAIPAAARIATTPARSATRMVARLAGTDAPEGYSRVVPQSPQRPPTTPAPADQRGDMAPAQIGQAIDPAADRPAQPSDTRSSSVTPAGVVGPAGDTGDAAGAGAAAGAATAAGAGDGLVAPQARRLLARGGPAGRAAAGPVGQGAHD